MLTQITKTPRVNKDTFNTFTKAQQRVIIAKDALKQLKAETFKPGVGYFNILRLPSTPSVQIGIETKEIKCSGCELGLLFLSSVRFKNELNIGDSVNRATIYDRLAKIFTRKQLGLIESAYEGANMTTEENRSPKIKKAIVFGEKYELYNKERMEAILNNIIDNSGTFIP